MGAPRPAVLTSLLRACIYLGLMLSSGTALSVSSEHSPLCLCPHPSTKESVSWNVTDCIPGGGDVSHQAWNWGDARLWSQIAPSLPAGSSNKPHNLSSVSSSRKWLQQEVTLCWMLRAVKPLACVWGIVGAR